MIQFGIDSFATTLRAFDSKKPRLPAVG